MKSIVFAFLILVIVCYTESVNAQHRQSDFQAAHLGGGGWGWGDFGCGKKKCDDGGDVDIDIDID